MFFKQKTAYEMLRSLVGSKMCIRDRDRAMEEEARRLLKVDGSDPGESSRGQHEE